MTMATRCPSCGTVFRVTPEQLQARRGQVRCGRCMTVFDGFRALTTLSDAVAAAGVELPEREAAVAPKPSASEFAEPEPAAVQSQDTAASPAPDVFDFGLEPIDERPTPAHADATGSVPPAVARQPSTPSAFGAEREESDQFYEASPRSTWPWWAGSVLLLLALIGQAGYYYRSDLAVRYPVLKTALVGMCKLAGCLVPLPQRPRLINIEASDMQAIDPARPGVIRLTATLRNHASHDVGYPALDLVLTNTREHALARRIFLPREYLDQSRDPAGGIPAKAEITVGVDLDTGSLGAAGFRLDLLPAP